MNKYKVGNWVEVTARENIYQDKITFSGIEFGKPHVLARKTKTLKFDPYTGKCFDEKRCAQITRKLKPSEVSVSISINGQIRQGCNESCFEISTPNGGWMEIGKEQISKDELEIVERLLKAQREEE